MKEKQRDSALKAEIREQAAAWLAEGHPPFVVAEEFARFVGSSASSDLAADELLAAILGCGFPCVRGDSGERVLWLRQTKAASASSASFVPTEAVREFVSSATGAQAA